MQCLRQSEFANLVEVWLFKKLFSFQVPWTGHGQCVVDNSSRLLSHGISIPGITPRLCIEGCSAKGFIFAGVQNGGQCFCGDTAPPQSSFAPAGECNKPCHGDGTKICGAIWRMNVYSTGLH